MNELIKKQQELIRIQEERMNRKDKLIILQEQLLKMNEIMIRELYREIFDRIKKRKHKRRKTK